MNKRIKELKEQATRGAMWPGDPDAGELDAERFAELLLVEYKKVILTMINNSHGDFDTLDQALTEINEHFGVEE